MSVGVALSGTVNISRGVWDDVAFKDEPFTEREAFIWMIMEASYKPRQKRVGSFTVDLERGQLATSVRFMCDAWDWSKSRVDRFLKRLENRDMIGTDSGTGINVITICKYDDYQNKPSGSGTPLSEKRDSSGTAAGQQRDKPNKGLIPEAIQEKKDTNVSFVVPAKKRAESAEDSQAFDQFWQLYPRKVGKDDARRSFAKAMKGATHDDIMFGLSQQIPKFERTEPKFIPHAATWLNQGRWKDEPEHQHTNGPHGNSGPARSGSSTVDAFAAVAARYEERERQG